MRLTKLDIFRLLVGGPLFIAGFVSIIVPVIMLFTSKTSKPGLWVIIVGLVVIEFILFLFISGPLKKWNKSGERKFTSHERNLNYASFSQRFFAGCIDVLVFSPLIISHYLVRHFTIADLMVFRILALLDYPYLLLMVAWRGQTIGKIAMGIKVYRANGGDVMMSNSFRRSVIDLSYYAMSSIGYGISISRLSQSMIDNLSYGKISVLMGEHNPFHRTLMVFSLVWLLSEYVSMLFNKQKRAIHDYLGGTIVLSEK